MTLWYLDPRGQTERLIERLTMAVAWRLPRSLVMWCAVRVIAHATTGEYGSQVVPDLRAVDALQRWDTRAALGKEGQGDG